MASVADLHEPHPFSATAQLSTLTKFRICELTDDSSHLPLSHREVADGTLTYNTPEVLPVILCPSYRPKRA